MASRAGGAGHLLGKLLADGGEKIDFVSVVAMKSAVRAASTYAQPSDYFIYIVQSSPTLLL